MLACAGVFVSYLPVVGVSTALPVIQQALHASTAGLQWITDAFILPTAALLMTFGIVGDLYGRKKVYLTGLVLTVRGCLTALTAHSVLQVCGGQALSVSPTPCTPARSSAESASWSRPGSRSS